MGVFFCSKCLKFVLSSILEDYNRCDVVAPSLSFSQKKKKYFPFDSFL